MCTGIAIGMLAATAFGTAATLYSTDTQAKQAESNLKFQAAQGEADAKAADGAARVEAERIRKAARAQRATATAQAAANGADIDSPTAVKIDEEIVRNSEEDALTTILNGGDRSARMRQQSRMDRIGAGLARSEGRQQQAATLISAAGTMTNYGQGWKKAGG